MSVSEEIAKRLEALPPAAQEQVLRFVASLADSCPAGKSGSSLRKLASSLDPVSAREMKQAIKEGCEQIDAGEW
jgi:hypothetical protein